MPFWDVRRNRICVDAQQNHYSYCAMQDIRWSSYTVDEGCEFQCLCETVLFEGEQVFCDNETCMQLCHDCFEEYKGSVEEES